ncbi:MAG: hypothetical protein ACI4F0_09630 [Agathobacter sp.]
MGKKKREHVVFDQMLKQKKSIPFSKVNKDCSKKKKKMNEVKNNIRQQYEGMLC